MESIEAGDADPGDDETYARLMNWISDVRTQLPESMSEEAVAIISPKEIS
ncbi:MAG: hypothetical protein QM811_23750 [Pirellulales bacterium]